METLDQALKRIRPKASRQRKWYWKMRSQNRCVVCGGPLEADRKIRCKVHHEAAKRKKRKLMGYKAWRPGGPGRPPKGAR